MTVFVVVSNQFASFSDPCGALSFSKACEKLKSDVMAKGDVFVQGQGLTDNEKTAIEAIAHVNDATESLALWRNTGDPVPAGRGLTHKHRLDNILISTPLLVGVNHYRSHFILSAQNELLLDHETGQHVQGMVLVEACRQMFIAVSELAHMDDGDTRKSYVVLNHISAKFLGFTFALPAQVEYRLLNINNKREDRIELSAAINIWQNGSKTTDLEVAYTLFEAATLKSKEISKGRAAVASYAAAIEQGLRPQAWAV